MEEDKDPFNIVSILARKDNEVEHSDIYSNKQIAKIVLVFPSVGIKTYG